jgi:ribose transport system substrate-binding protein
MTTRHRLGLGAVLLVLCMVLAGCAGNNQGSGSSAAGASACGTVPDLKTTGSADLTGLPQDVRAGYDGYFAPVNTSTYADFKSTKTGGFKIGYSDSFAANAWRAAALDRLKSNVAAWKAKGLVSELVNTNSNLDNNLQIQQITSMINQKVDAIIAIPNSPTAFNGVIQQAHDAGIPFITMNSHVTSPYAINIDPNYFLTGVKVAAGLAAKMGGKGNVVIADGINGAPASTQLHNGYLQAFKSCPGIKVTGSVEGQWNNATAKTVMLQYLATHPGKVDGVVNSGYESVGIAQALQQSGRPLAPIGDANPDIGSLLLFRDQLADRFVASTAPPQPSADAALHIAVGTLLGYGPKFDAVIANPPVVSDKDALGKWIESGWKKDDPGPAPAPPDTPFFAPDMSVFFQRPAALPALT